MSNENENETLNVPGLNDPNFLAGIRKARQMREMGLKGLGLLPREMYRRLEIAAIQALLNNPAILRDVVGLMVAHGKLDVEKILLREDDNEPNG